MANLTRKLWVGIGAVALVGATAEGQSPPPAGHGAHGVKPAPAEQVGKAASTPAQGGETYLTDGGPSDSRVRILFNIDLIRGHLLVGHELIGEGRWDEALPHFLHPTEEVYAQLEGYIKLHGVQPFDRQLKALAQAVKAKNTGTYEQARKVVEQRMTGAVAVFKQFMTPLYRFAAEAAVETLKAAQLEYASSIEDGRFSKPVEYQDSRGFVWQAELTLRQFAGDLDKIDKARLDEVRQLLAELKKAWPAAMPPERPVLDAQAVAALVFRIEARMQELR